MLEVLQLSVEALKFSLQYIFLKQVFGFRCALQVSLGVLCFFGFARLLLVLFCLVFVWVVLFMSFIVQ